MQNVWYSMALELQYEENVKRIGISKTHISQNVLNSNIQIKVDTISYVLWGVILN